MTGYATPRAVITAATDRSKAAAAITGRRADQHLREYIYTRFLARVFADPAEPWVLKGGTAMLIRVTDTRATKDIDLMHATADVARAIAALEEACRRPNVDHLRFTIIKRQPLAAAEQQPGRTGYRITLNATAGVKIFSEFHVDLVTGTHLIIDPEIHTPDLPVQLPGIPTPQVRLYPICHHIADKVAAIEHTYRSEASSRVRDLVDLVVFAVTHEVNGTDLARTIAAERSYRGLPAVPTLTTPQWHNAYERQNLPSIAAEFHDYTRARDLVRALIEPALTDQANGRTWQPGGRAWSEPNPGSS